MRCDEPSTDAMWNPSPASNTTSSSRGYQDASAPQATLRRPDPSIPLVQISFAAHQFAANAIRGCVAAPLPTPPGLPHRGDAPGGADADGGASLTVGAARWTIRDDVCAGALAQD